MLRRIGVWLLLIVAALVMLSMAQPAASGPTDQTWYVDPVNGNDATGTGSVGAPWRSLKRALQSAVAGDSINALAGTYNTTTGEVFPINWPPGVKLMGAGRDVAIIQGQSSQGVILLLNNSTNFYSDTVISGVTVRGGGAGIQLYSTKNHVTSPTILNVRATANSIGIRIDPVSADNYGDTVAPLISNTETLSNFLDGFYFHAGGGYSANNVAPVLVHCTAHGNGRNGLTLDSANGNTALADVVSSDFSGNQGDGIAASGLYQGVASLHLESSTLIHNTGNGFSWQQGPNIGSTATTITNTLIAGNKGGGIYLGDVSPDEGGGGSVRLVNTTIADNTSYGVYWASGGGAVVPTVVNTIIWNPKADDLYATNSSWTTGQVQYSDIEDGDFKGQSGNFSSDPWFDETYHLVVCSPAIDAGTLNGAPAIDFDGELRPQGLAPDVGMDEVSTPCLLRSAKTVSSSQARYGDVLTYTLQITNVTPITTLNVILTDVLPTAVSYISASLTASQGTPQYQAGLVTWTGDLVPSDTVTVSLAAKVARGNINIQNQFSAEAVGYGLFKSRSVATQVEPIACFLPMIYRNYCAGPFLDNFSNPASGWPIAETTYWSYGYTGGEYRFYAKQSAFGAVSRGDKTGRFIVEVDARQVSAVNGSFGILFQLNDDWSDLYTFEIYPATQEWAVFRRVGSTWYLLKYGSSSAILPGYNTNRLRIAWRQQTVSFDDYAFYVNGQQVLYLSYIYAPTPVRRVGLTATSDGAGFDVRFDNYKFVAEGCPEIPAAQVSSAADTHHEQPSLDQLPAVWLKHLQTRNSPALRAINQGRQSLSEQGR